ncbi:hypothetical protein N8198_10820 [Gammaproteobacteria bacterium]|nr:hypothetical protein [Gammaproteobacteria bacterium]
MTDDIDKQLAKTQAALAGTRLTIYRLASLDAADTEPALQNNILRRAIAQKMGSPITL